MMVRNWLTLLGILWLSIALHASQAEILHGYQTGLQTAQKENKILLLMISQEGCPMCIYMKDNTLKDPEVSAFIRQNFVFAEASAADEDLPERFESFVTPTFFFVDPKNGKAIGDPVRGGFRAPAFLRVLKIYLKEKDQQHD